MQAIAEAIPHSAVHEAHHEEVGFWRSYVFSTDHKVIGIQYGVTALFFLFFGFCLMMIMRWQIAHSGEAVPIGVRCWLRSSGICGQGDCVAGPLQRLWRDA